MHYHSFIVLFLSFFHFIYATPVPGEAQLLRIPNDPDLRRPWPPRPLPSNCVNTATNRSCWTRGYDINSNPETTWPNTGRIVRYNLEVQNLTLAPDGVSRPVYAINGQFPGPTIKANWGDTIFVTVKNSLQNNGTSMHWHGVRQWKTNPMDGTNGITGKSAIMSTGLDSPPLLTTCRMSSCPWSVKNVQIYCYTVWHFLVP